MTVREINQYEKTQKAFFGIYKSDVDMLGNPVFYARHIFYDFLGAWPNGTSRDDVLRKQLANSRGRYLCWKYVKTAWNMAFGALLILRTSLRFLQIEKKDKAAIC